MDNNEFNSTEQIADDKLHQWASRVDGTIRMFIADDENKLDEAVKNFKPRGEIGEYNTDYKIYEACKDKMNGSACHDLYIYCYTIAELYHARVEIQIMIDNGLIKCLSDDVYLSKNGNVVFITNCIIFRYDASREYNSYMPYRFGWVVLHDSNIHGFQIQATQPLGDVYNDEDKKDAKVNNENKEDTHIVFSDDVLDMIEDKSSAEISCFGLPRYNMVYYFQKIYRNVQMNGHLAHDLAVMCRYLSHDDPRYEFQCVLKDGTDIMTRANDVQLFNDDTLLIRATGSTIGPGGLILCNTVIHSDDVSLIYSRW